MPFQCPDLPPPLVLEGRRLQPPPRYSGPLPQSNTQISQSAGRLHVQSSPIPAGSSASRLTPTAPVLSNSERESLRRPAVTSETELLSVLPENAFLLSLAKRWKEPPLSYYTMVAEKTATLLQRLAEWPTTLAHHPTFAVPNYEEFPTSSFVVEDLLAMDRPLIHYKELCAQDSTPTDTVSAVLDMLFKSHLMQPWRTGQKLISTYDIVATDKGMLRCRLDWPAIVQQLGVGFAFGDYRWQHTPEELSKIFPPMSPKSSKSAPERAQYLDRRGKEPWVASVQTPPGWVSDTHTDLSSVAQAIVHCDGEKLCLFWPSTSQNLEWWGLPRIRHTSRLEEALDALEGLEVMHITEPCTFIIPPFCIHAVITFAGSTHTCVSFAHAAHWPMAKEGLEFCKRLIRDPIYPHFSRGEVG
ncbi:hypothetical protein B0H14DRAFT_1413195 [Mycena olivaceomarginata]|nr:hypothetical protein B0H14DRAFT_1413195 [Mycena olivaceomarginata]